MGEAGVIASAVPHTRTILTSINRNRRYGHIFIITIINCININTCIGTISTGEQ